ncbi:MAG: phosphotransferase [Candidatus Kerfeldbacteria bacterium]|nr:phosphotransferase [Candidatus Kerfeldbacteria bacterium]
MNAYRIIPTAPDKIRQALDHLRVRPVQQHYTPEVAAQKNSRFYMTPVVGPGGRLAWFKASLQDTPWLHRSLREEILVQKTFAAYEKKYRPVFDSPSYITAAEGSRGFSWLLRKYWQGTYAGDMDDRFGMTSSFLRRVSHLTMARVFGDVRQMTPLVRKRVGPNTHGLSWYLLDFHYYRQHFFTPLLQHTLNPGWKRDDIDRMEEIFHAHRAFFRQHATVFTHGDMYPNNMMVRGQSAPRVVLFDWELSHLNLPTFDPTMVYLQAWRQPQWQERFRRQTMTLLGQPRVSETAWRLSMLSLATRLTAFCFIRLTDGQPDRYPRATPTQRTLLRSLYPKMLKHLRLTYGH